MTVQEMFVSVYVRDMQRAVTFYMNALGAAVDFASESWSCLVIAGIRVSLELRDQAPSSTGLHFIVADVARACAAVAVSGGRIAPAVEGAGGVVIAQIVDSEGNAIILHQLTR